MKINTIIAVALSGFTTLAHSLPSIVSTRSGGPVDLLHQDILSLQAGIYVNLDVITTAITSIGGSATGQVLLIADINVQLTLIVNAILVTTPQIITYTQGAATTLNSYDYATLVATIQVSVDLITAIEVTLKNRLITLPAATQLAIESEYSALQTAAANLMAPIQAYGGRCVTAVGDTGVSVVNLQVVVQALVTIVASLTVSLTINLGIIL